MPLSTCIVKVQDSNHTWAGLRACGKAVEFVAATPPEVPYSGWYHCDRATDHHAVPSGHGCPCCDRTADHHAVPKGWT